MARIGGPLSAGYLEDDDFEDIEVEEGIDPNDQDVMVDVGTAEPNLPSQFQLTDDDNILPFTGDMSGGVPEELFDDEFDLNVAEDLEDSYLEDLGRDLVLLVEDDIQDRQPLFDRMEKGLKMMGLTSSEMDDGPFPGASNVTHPMIAEAVTQFWARSFGELIPPEGPVKGKPIGQQTEQNAAAAERISEYMNYDIIFEDEGYRSETSRLLWQLPCYGSGFRKTFRDPILDKNTGIYVPCEDLIAPAEATDLATTPRFTHRMRKFRNEVERLQLIGHFRDIDLGDPDHTVQEDEMHGVKMETQDVDGDGNDINDTATQRYEILEISVFLDVPGYEHRDDEGDITGMELPWVVTVDRGSETVLAMRRNWEPDDDRFRRELCFEKYDFIPGLGFYGLGLFHLIGGLQAAATGSLRVLLDGAASASMSGGFVTKHANIKGKDMVTEPGRWQTVDASVDDLRKAFFPAPVKEPAPALFQLLSFLVDAGKSFIGTTELMTGDADPKNSPVGSTIAMIEQGGKVMSTIHQMLHASLGRELRFRKKLSERYAPEEGYPYEVEGEERSVYFEDFAMAHVLPVADPNIFSTQQRMAINGELYRMAMETGELPMRKVIKRILLDMKVSDHDDLLPDEQEAQVYDGAGEIQAIVLGKPVKVIPEQPHVAHLAVLTAFAQNPSMGGNPVVAEQIMPNLMTVAAQHLAFAFAQQAAQAGVQAGFMDPESGQVMQPGEVPPEVITEQLAQMAPMIAQFQGIPGGPEEGGDPAAEAKIMEIEAKTQAMQQKAQIDTQQGEQKLQMQQQEHSLKLRAEQEKMQWEQHKEQMKANLEMQKEQMKLQIEEMKAQNQMQIEAMKANMQAEQAQMDAQNQAMQADQEMRLNEQQAVEQSAQMAHESQLREHEAEQGMRHSEEQHQQAGAHAEENQKREGQLAKMKAKEGPSDGSD